MPYLGQPFPHLDDLPTEPAASCCDDGHVALHTLFLLREKQSGQRAQDQELKTVYTQVMLLG